MDCKPSNWLYCSTDIILDCLVLQTLIILDCPVLLTLSMTKTVTDHFCRTRFLQKLSLTVSFYRNYHWLSFSTELVLTLLKPVVSYRCPIREFNIFYREYHVYVTSVTHVIGVIKQNSKWAKGLAYFVNNLASKMKTFLGRTQFYYHNM